VAHKDGTTTNPDKTTQLTIHQINCINNRIHPINRPDGLLSSLKAITMNVKGMYKSKDDLNALIEHHDPDIISFTETRITSNIDPPAWLYPLLKEYSWWQCPHHSAGTLFCLHKNIVLTTQATLVQNTPHTIKGRLLAVRLEISGPPIKLFSTYWPSQDSTSALQQRDKLAFKINQVINSQRCIPIILGDMNATFKENDRSSHIFLSKRCPLPKIHTRRPSCTYRS